ncbi:uncharacterized protein [Anabrus simplex]|uniref:uncharacterized protein n=1 Tax=Anabrus simplex TaxID=316456 RepID=UPI0035A3D54F
MLLSFVLATMILGSEAISEQCGRSPSLKFSVSSWRNESGHRLVAAELQSHVSYKDSVSLAVELFSQKCGDSSAVILKTLSSSGQPEEQETISTTVAPTVLPLPGYHHLPGFGYYKKLPNTMKWENGVEACRKEGTHMLLLESQEELDAVYGWCGCDPWIGVHRESSSGPWINVSGQQMNSTDFFGWHPGYPRGQDNCMKLDASTHKWTFNTECHKSFLVICEQM